MSDKPQLRTLKDKIYQITDTAKGAIQFIKAYSTVVHEEEDKAEELLKPYIEKFIKFMNNKNGDLFNYHDVVNYGTPFLLTHESFFRSEHIYEDVELTKEEQLEVLEELEETIAGPEEDKIQMYFHAAAVGHQLKLILLVHADLAAIEKMVEEKLAKLKNELVDIALAAQLSETVEPLKTAYTLAEKLIDQGVAVMEDGSLRFQDPEAEVRYNRHKTGELFDIVSNEALKPVLEEALPLASPLAKLVTTVTKTYPKL
jgi:hypothetical protein